MPNRMLRFGVLGSFLSVVVQPFPTEFSPDNQAYPRTTTMSGCPFSRKYQKIDGSCNNYANPKSGATFVPLRRLLDHDYADGIQAPRRGKDGNDLPNSRMISTTLKHAAVEDVDSKEISHMFVQLGQFLAHDTTNTQLEQEKDKSDITCACDSDRPECLKIIVPDDDRLRHKRACIPLVRSAAYAGTSVEGKPREQFNTLTAYWDGNTVYSSDEKMSKELRDAESESGELLVRRGPDGAKTDSLPFLGQVSEETKNLFTCPGHLHSNKSTCFAAGEGRVNENIGLMCMHAVFMREHNRISRILKELNPHWSANDTFWETRKIISAITQQITYGEFLPILVGQDNMASYGMNVMKNGFYHGYDETYDASISNVWATAAFRYGHSMVRMQVSQLDADYNPVGHMVGIHETLFNPNALQQGSDFKDSNVIRGLLQDPAENADIHMNEGLRSFMFESETKAGLDLMAINIQRGREHGLPGYNQYRVYCGLRRAIVFEDLLGEIEKNKVQILSTLYRNVDDIDIFVGGVIETPLSDAAVGPTFACLNSEQFRALRKGDKAWFENPGSFSYEQLQELRKVTLSSLLCNNLIDMKTVQPRSLLLESVAGNERIPCSDIPDIDFFKWKDVISSYEESGIWSRWFPNTNGKSIQKVMEQQLTYHADQTCRNPLHYEEENLNGEVTRKRIRFLCPQGTISYSDVPKSIKGYTWTRWMDRDTPKSSKGNDFESVERLLAENPQDMCPNPMAIQARTVSMGIGLNPQDTVEHFNVVHGLVCRADHQSSGVCSDYAVRYLCPNKFFEDGYMRLQSIDKNSEEWTDWMNVDTGEGKGDFESASLARFLGIPVCRSPLMIEGRLAHSTGVSATKTNDVLKRFSPLYGLQCRNEDQENGICHDYEVRYLCKKKR